MVPVWALIFSASFFHSLVVVPLPRFVSLSFIFLKESSLFSLIVRCACAWRFCVWRKVVLWVTCASSYLLSKCGTVSSFSPGQPFRSSNVNISFTFFFSVYYVKRNSYSVSKSMKLIPHSVSKKKHGIFMKRILESVSHHFETDHVCRFAEKLKNLWNGIFRFREVWNGLQNPFQKVSNFFFCETDFKFRFTFFWNGIHIPFHKFEFYFNETESISKKCETEFETDSMFRFSLLRDGFQNPFQWKKKEKKNELCVSFQPFAKRISQSVSVKKKTKRIVCSVSGMFETDLESRFGEKLRRDPFLIFMKQIL